MRNFRSKILLLAKIVMPPIVLAALALAVGIHTPLKQFAAKPVDLVTTVIDDVTVIDPRSGTAQQHQTVIIEGKWLRYVGPLANAPAIGNARHIAGAGKFLSPGLWDAHAHTLKLSPQLHFPLMLANGVTGMRDMGDGCSWSGDLQCEPDVRSWREQITRGALLAPRIAATASYHVEEYGDGEPGDAAALARQAGALVAALKARGDDVVKLQLDNDVDPARFEAIVAQANIQGVQVAGHLPFSVDLLDPALGALNSIEHDSSLLPQCSTRDVGFDGRNGSKAALLARADDKRCNALLEHMARRGTAYTPTHVASIGQDWTLLSGAYRDDERVKYVVAPQRWIWRFIAKMSVSGTEAEHRAPLEAYYRASLKLTQRANAHGVTVLAGADAMDPYVVHGFGLHDELAQLVLAGLTPAQALKTATWNPVRHLGFERHFGTVETGKIADMLLLDGNPMEDIRHLQKIDSLFYDGKHYSRNELDAMLAFVQDQASSYATACKFIWAIIVPW